MIKSEELIMQAIKHLNLGDSSLKLEFIERKRNYLVLPARFDEQGNTIDEVTSKEIELMIYKKGEKIYTQSYFADEPRFREVAFERMLHTIILTGIVYCETASQLRAKGYEVID